MFLFLEERKGDEDLVITFTRTMLGTPFTKIEFWTKNPEQKSQKIFWGWTSFGSGWTRSGSGWTTSGPGWTTSCPTQGF